MEGALTDGDSTAIQALLDGLEQDGIDAMEGASVWLPSLSALLRRFALGDSVDRQILAVDLRSAFWGRGEGPPAYGPRVARFLVELADWLPTEEWGPLLHLSCALLGWRRCAIGAPTLQDRWDLLFPQGPPSLPETGARRLAEVVAIVRTRPDIVASAAAADVAEVRGMAAGMIGHLPGPLNDREARILEVLAVDADARVRASAVFSLAQRSRRLGDSLRVALQDREALVRIVASILWVRFAADPPRDALECLAKIRFAGDSLHELHPAAALDYPDLPWGGLLEVDVPAVLEQRAAVKAGESLPASRFSAAGYDVG